MVAVRLDRNRGRRARRDHTGGGPFNRSAAAAALRAELRKISERKQRWGYRRGHARLREEGWQVNRKRVQRLGARKACGSLRGHPSAAEVGVGAGECGRLRPRLNEVWALDYLADQSAEDRMLRLLNIIDSSPASADDASRAEHPCRPDRRRARPRPTGSSSFRFNCSDHKLRLLGRAIQIPDGHAYQCLTATLDLAIEAGNDNLLVCDEHGELITTTLLNSPPMTPHPTHAPRRSLHLALRARLHDRRVHTTTGKRSAGGNTTHPAVNDVVAAVN